MPLKVRKKMPEAPIMPSEVKKKRNASRERTQRPPESAYKAMGYAQGGKMKAEPMYAKIGCKVYNNR